MKEFRSNIALGLFMKGIKRTSLSKNQDTKTPQDVRTTRRRRRNKIAKASRRRNR